MSRRIRIQSLVRGAERARGLTVVIDVFRAFSLEAYLYAAGVKEIIPVMTVEKAWELKNRDPGAALIGERKGIKIEGFDFGNSPSTLRGADLAGKTVVHTTSAGTRGLLSVPDRRDLITGSFVNASAVARYIMASDAEEVTLVPMGLGGARRTDEDELCALYIKSLVEGNPIKDIDKELRKLKYTDGSKFFSPMKQKVFPEDDFWMCIQRDLFDFVIKVENTKDGLETRKVEIKT